MSYLGMTKVIYNMTKCEKSVLKAFFYDRNYITDITKVIFADKKCRPLKDLHLYFISVS